MIIEAKILPVVWLLGCVLGGLDCCAADPPAATTTAAATTTPAATTTAALVESLDKVTVQCGTLRVRLPAPTMAPGLPAAERAAALKQAAGKYSMDRWMRDSIVAPFVFDKTTLKDDSGQRVGYRLDLWFVAYGDLAAVEERGLFAEMLGADADDKDAGGPLTEAELAARDIQLPSDAGVARQLVRYSVPVMDRVQVAGVVRTESVRGEDFLLGFSQIDERFNQDDQLANRWWSIEEGGQPAEAQAQPYSGFAGYAIATELAEPKGALLIECHAVIHEPYGWFAGRSLLSSKLPLLVQDNVRQFRRSLAKAK